MRAPVGFPAALGVPAADSPLTVIAQPDSMNSADQVNVAGTA
jgi:hypothetical protein